MSDTVEEMSLPERIAWLVMMYGDARQEESGEHTLMETRDAILAAIADMQPVAVTEADAVERVAAAIADALTVENRLRWLRGGSSGGYPPLDIEVTPSIFRVARAAIAAMPAQPVAVTEQDAAEKVAEALDRLPDDVIRVVQDDNGRFVVIDWQRIARAAIAAMQPVAVTEAGE